MTKLLLSLLLVPAVAMADPIKINFGGDTYSADALAAPEAAPARERPPKRNGPSWSS